MKKYLKLFYLSFILIGISNHGLNATESIACNNKTQNNIINKICDMQNIVNNRASAKEKESQLEQVILEVFNYELFFRFTLGGELWSSFSDEAKRGIIKKYNTKYVSEYFTQITECKNLNINVKDSDVKSIIGYYTCNGDNRKDLQIRKTKTQDRIADISINGVSFIATEKENFANALNNKSNIQEKQNCILKVGSCAGKVNYGK